MTCDDDIARDVGDLFNFLTGFARQAPYRKVIVSPLDTRQRVIALIDGETRKGPAGRIDIKVNGLTDPSIIDALYRASQAGVPVRLAVRTLCCLRPGIEGLSETITVRSVVGEFLEHSRVFIFGDWQENPQVFIGSADLMERNLDRRVEVVVPIEDERLKPVLLATMDLVFADDCFAWVLALIAGGAGSRRSTTCPCSVSSRSRRSNGRAPWRSRSRRSRHPWIATPWTGKTPRRGGSAARSSKTGTRGPPGAPAGRGRRTPRSWRSARPRRCPARRA